MAKYELTAPNSSWQILNDPFELAAKSSFRYKCEELFGFILSWRKKNILYPLLCVGTPGRTYWSLGYARAYLISTAILTVISIY
jgi:hypothetical protein